MARKPRGIDHTVKKSVRMAGRLLRGFGGPRAAPPGTLVAPSVQKVEKVRIRFLDYDEESLNERTIESIEPILPLRVSPTVSWINIDGLHDLELVEWIGKNFKVHPLILEDIVAAGQRAKLDEYDDQIFVVLAMLSWDEEHRSVVNEQVSFLLASNWIFSFQERYGDVFEPVRERIRKLGTRLRRGGPDYLLYALIDAVVDQYFDILEKLGDQVEALDELVMEDPTPHTLKKIHDLKQEALLVRKAVWPLRETLSSMIRTDNPLIPESTNVFLRDVHDHAVQVIDTVETIRDLASGLTDLYMSSVGNRQNEIMKVLTIMASIFIPLTFMAGIYGMNFEWMPELGIRAAYPTLLASMAVVAGFMLLWFHRKGWL